MRVTAEDIRGTEHDWLAVDRDGHVALFSTAGGSAAPPAYLRDIEGYEVAIAAILALPGPTGVAAQPPGSWDNTWREVADRGLFAYDGEFNRGAYRLLERPALAVAMAARPPAIAAVCARVRFAHLTFAATVAITDEDVARAEDVAATA
ncbi:MAG: hypothetical protein K8W52_46810 [Deltaproteobacteria bacterium]|nr:hypothetical protein [Deltaproteobacteria bacterium]